jgi:hypothetical protein
MISRVTFNADLPAIPQDDPWSCSLTALRWALTALGRNPTEGFIEGTALEAGVVTQEFGLMNASGAGLAAFIKQHWGEFGFDANNEDPISFRDAALEGGHAYPILIGGRGWNHWCAVRGYDEARDLLLLANSADGHMGVHQTMSAAQFSNLGSFSMVRVFHPDVVPA